MRMLLCALLLVTQVLVACSGGDAPDPSVGAGSVETDESPEADRSPRRAGGGRKDRAEARAEGDRNGKGRPSRAGDGGAEDRGSVFEDSAEDDRSSAAYPAAGRYVYRQSGYERFCQAARCEEQPLPPTQPIDIALRERTPDRAVVINEIRASGNRTVRTTSTFSRDAALVTEVYARFSYEGFTFEETYRPEPPVESLRFPLRDGASWAGRWRDSTSGEYSIDVIGTEQVLVRGRAVNAFKLSSVTTFEGDFDGTAKALIWVDLATKVVVKTTGKLDLTSAFGRYITEFTNTLRSGPSY